MTDFDDSICSKFSSQKNSERDNKGNHNNKDKNESISTKDTDNNHDQSI